MRRAWRREGSVDVVIDAPPEVIYDEVADITGMSARSDECRRCEWVGDLRQPARGAQFRGSNRVGLARWSRTCEITEADRPFVFSYRTVPTRLDPSRRDSTLWMYRFEPRDGGTLVTHSYEITVMPVPPFRQLYGVAFPHHRDMRPQMRETLERLKATVEAGRTAAS